MQLLATELEKQSCVGETLFYVEKRKNTFRHSTLGARYFLGGPVRWTESPPSMQWTPAQKTKITHATGQIS